MANQSGSLDLFDEIHEARTKKENPTHPAGTVTGWSEDDGLPIVKMGKAATGPTEPKPAESSPAKTPANQVKKEEVAQPAQEPPEVGQKDKKSGRDILQPSHDPKENQKLATEGHDQVLPEIKKIVASIPGAQMAGARPEKDSQRTKEKIEDEGKPAATIPDYSALRISVDSPAVKDKVVDAIKDNFPLVKEKDEFDKGSSGEGFNAVMLQIQSSNGASHEVQILPKEVADIAEPTHDLYAKSRGGDKEAQASLKTQNAAAMDKFNARNNEKPASEPKYKFGNTQVNLPEGSEAHKAIRAMQSKIPNEHLAGDGKDVDDPHVTVRYGVKSPGKIKDYVGSQQPFEAKLGKTIAFPPSEHSDGASPIVAQVESKDLHRMNGEIKNHGDFEPSNFKDYRPHVTVAYVKPEHAAKYTGMKDGEGKSFPVNSVSLSDRDGKKEAIPMNGKSNKGDAAAPEQAGAGIKQPASTFKKGDHVLLKDGRSASVDFHDSKLTKRARVTADDGEKISSIPGEHLTAVTSTKAKENSPHVLVDLDGTMAHYDKFKGPTVIGAPVPAMISKVKKMLAEGEDVRVFTARVAKDPDGKVTRAIEAWLQKNLGQTLPITNVKDQHAKAIYDDRAVAVEKNTGKVLGATSANEDTVKVKPHTRSHPSGEKVKVEGHTRSAPNSGGDDDEKNDGPSSIQRDAAQEQAG